MIFWITLASVIIGIIIYLITDDKYSTFADILNTLGMIFSILGGLALLIMIPCLIIVNATPEADHATFLEQYNSLTYQYEQNMYDNDNDIGKKELMNDILEYNSSVITGRINNDNIWIGMFVPDIYDDLPLIELSEKNEP